MNALHRWVCASSRWKSIVETRTFPWVLDGIELGQRVLEVGPGPGIATDLLRNRVKSLSCVEIDRRLAASLERRTAGTNVTVVREDATAMSFADGLFDTALSFTMLHHLPSAALQNRLLGEVLRVLRPGGIFAGVDSLYSRAFALLHLFDTMTMVDPRTFPDRLGAAGFVDIEVDTNQTAFRFRARKSTVGAAVGG
jgi:SAM-dependent methyltransferase